MKVASTIACSLLALGLGACGEQVGRPLPEPPALAPIDPTLIIYDPMASLPVGSELVALAGQAGALADGASLRVINLNTAELVDVEPSPFPSEFEFSVQIEAEEGDWLRFEQSLDGVRALPTDIRLPPPSLSAVERLACVSFSGAPYVEFADDSFSAELLNSCDQPIVVERSELSRTTTQLSLTTEPEIGAELSLASGESISVLLQRSGTVTATNVALVVVRVEGEQIPYASVVLPE